jgi:hypothetical protein
MTILNKLASALNRRDEAPNQALADEIVRTSDTGAIGELVKNLSNKNKSIQKESQKKRVSRVLTRLRN